MAAASAARIEAHAADPLLAGASAATILARSSGAPPAAIAVLRISGPGAGLAVTALAQSLPPPREARLRVLRYDGQLLDRALVLWFPGPDTATGEDLAELHLHGGRAVVAAVEIALAAVPGLRRAAPGEFTRRAFANGRIDLAEAEGLADLLSAETALQLQQAIALSGGVLSRRAEQWRVRLLGLSAQLEALLDFSDEDDVAALPSDFRQHCSVLAGSITEWLDRPRAERLRDGFRVVLAGPPNAGKSTLLNALVEREAAITSPIAGTTRDVIDVLVALDGIPFVFSDTAGLREDGADLVEAIGIARAQAMIAAADLVLWLGPEGQADFAAPNWEVCAQIDRADTLAKIGAEDRPVFRVSALTGEGMPGLRAALVAHARQALPKPNEAGLNARQAQWLSQCVQHLRAAAMNGDLLLAAEDLRLARVALDGLTGRSGTEDMLDALFGRFCIGK